MRTPDVAAIHADLLAEFGEDVETLDTADAVTWSGQGIAMVPGDVTAGGELAYVVGTTPLAFPESLPLPPVPIGARLRRRGSVWRVDGAVSDDASKYVVLLLPS